MGDVRFDRPYQRVREATDRAAAIRDLADEEVIAALAAASSEKDPYLANVLASEAMNRVRRKGTIVQTASEGLVSQDAQGRVTYLNPAAERMLGWRLDELAGQPMHEALQPEGGPEPLHARVIRTRQPVPRHETSYARKEGTRFPVEQSAAPILREGDVEGVVVTFTDVTERRRAEAAVRQLASIVEASDDAIILYATDGVILTWNRGAEILYGYVAAEVVGRNVMDLMPPAMQPGFVAMMEEAARGAPIRAFETTRLRKDGTTVEVNVTISPVRDASGRVVALSGISRDVTPRKRAEAERREAEARKTAILQASLDAIVTIDAESRVIEWNAAAERIFGWSAEEARGHDLAELIIPPRYRDAHRHGLARYLATGEGPVLGRRVELPAVRRDGTEFPSELSILPLDSGERPLFTGFLRDITEQKRAAAATRESEERFRRIFASNPLPTWVFDAETHRFLDVNDAAIEKYGYSRDEFLQMRVTDVRPGSDVPRFRDYLAQHPPGRRFSAGWRHRLKDGRLVDVEVATHRIDYRGRPAFLAVIHDVTERRRADRELAASEERLRALYEHSPTMYLTVGADGTILSSNRYGANYLGYVPEEIVGLKAWDLHHPEDREHGRANHMAFVEEAPPLGEVREWEGRKLTKRGQVLWVREAVTRFPSEDGSVVALVACYDVSAQRRAAAELEASRRRVASILESITDAFFALDRDWRFTYLNREAERAMMAAGGADRAGLVGRSVWDAFPTARGTEFERQYRKAMEERVAVHFEARLEPVGLWFDVHAYPAEDGISVFFRDVTDRKRAPPST